MCIFMIAHGCVVIKLAPASGNAIDMNVWREYARDERHADTVHFIACLNFQHSPLFRKVHANWLTLSMGHEITK